MNYDLNIDRELLLPVLKKTDTRGSRTSSKDQSWKACLPRFLKGPIQPEMQLAIGKELFN